MIQYPHNRDTGGDAIANGFVYRGKLIPALKDKLVFADITTGRIWYANRADMLAADDGNPTTVAPIYEMETGLRRLTEETFRTRGGKGEAIPGMGAQAGRGRVDLRFAIDNDGELYILTKSDGMIRKVVGAKATTTPTSTANTPAPGAGQDVASRASHPPNEPRCVHARVDRGREAAYDVNCAACHGNLAQGAVKAGMTISIIEEQKGKQPSDLTDDQWDHGSSDGEIFTVIKRGLPPTMMAGFDGRISDQDIWNIVNYLRALRSPK